MERHVAQVALWNRFWLVVVLGGLGWLLLPGLSDLRRPRAPLRVGWQGDELVIASGHDGPYLVTHLAVHQPGRAIDTTAALVPPVAVTESGRTIVPAAELRSLKWRDRLGRTAPTPDEGTPLRALWVRGSWTPGVD